MVLNKNNEKRYSVADIAPFLPPNRLLHIQDDAVSNYFSDAKPLNECSKTSITFIDSYRHDQQEAFENNSAGLLICGFSITIDSLNNYNVIVQVDNPKLVFSIIVNALHVKRPGWGVHPTAVISANAQIHRESYIGPFTYIGKSKVGKGSIIYGNCHIYDRVEIGKNVIIHAGTVIGSDGFGYSRDENEVPTQFPHIGSIIIEDYVEVGANTAIDQGSLGLTKIGFASKIDNVVHIGHNVKIGKCCYIAAQTAIAGSSNIGDYSEIWMGGKIADGLKTGPRSTLGIGSVVIRDVEDNKRVFGNPARVIADNSGKGK